MSEFCTSIPQEMWEGWFFSCFVLFWRQGRFLKGILFAHLLNVCSFELILCNSNEIFQRLWNIQVLLFGLKEDALIHVTCSNLSAQQRHSFLTLRLGHGIPESTHSQLWVNKWLQQAHAAGGRWQRRKETRKMYTKSQWCTCKGKKRGDRFIPTPEITPHLDRRGPTFFHNNTLSTHEFSQMRKSDRCRECWNFPLLLFAWLYYSHLSHKRLEVKVIILSVGKECREDQ